MVQTPFPKRSPFNSGDFGNGTKKVLLTKQQTLLSFSPLTGILVRWLKYFLERAHLLKFQSPYGDFGTLTSIFVTVTGLSITVFQSPYGDFGTLTPLKNLRHTNIAVFQSPYGDFGTLTGARNSIGLNFSVVSVPLRGFWYADVYQIQLWIDGSMRSQSPYGDFGTLTCLVKANILKVSVSVPLRGFW